MIRPDQLATSFHAQVDRSANAEALAAQAEAIGSVSGVEIKAAPEQCLEQLESLVDACQSLPERESADLVVWLVVGTDPDEAEAVHRALQAKPELADVEYIDIEATEADFREFYTHVPELIESVDLEQLPLSFRLLTEDLTDVERNDLVTRLESLSAAISKVEVLTSARTICQDTVDSKWSSFAGTD